MAPGIPEAFQLCEASAWFLNRAANPVIGRQSGAARAMARQSRFERTLKTMSRVPSLSSPFLLRLRRDRACARSRRQRRGRLSALQYRAGRPRQNGQPERLRITLAVAGFTRDQLDVTVEENQLVIRGRQQDDKTRQYLHRGIAARQFQRTFVLADGMEVLGADLKNGLLAIDLARPEPERVG